VTATGGGLRTLPVRITGTSYLPPKDEEEIKNKFSGILTDAKAYKNPLEKAVYLHSNIARLQPFIDGNKRTSRLIESITLMNADIIPVYSSREADLLHYRKGLLHFYETKDYSEYVKYFLDRQITRINEIAPADEQFKFTSGIQPSKGRSL
jgi:Fic family protein